MSLPFTISKPAGEGPFPAVVLLHDCSGLGPHSSGAPARWSRELVEQGYVTIRPDSFAPRGYPEGVCRDPSAQVRYYTRARDAYEALRYLQSLPYVDAKHIGVMGGSHGGSSTLATLVDIPINEKAKPGFVAGIAFYPGCGAKFGAWNVTRENGAGTPIKSYDGLYKPLAPLLILGGELDDWTPVAFCRVLAERSKASGLPVEIKIYPNAHHSFDSRAPVKFDIRRRNFNAPSGRGATIGGNQEAWDDAKIQVRDFFAKYLKPAK